MAYLKFRVAINHIYRSLFLICIACCGYLLEKGSQPLEVSPEHWTTTVNCVGSQQGKGNTEAIQESKMHHHLQI